MTTDNVSTNIIRIQDFKNYHGGNHFLHNDIEYYYQCELGSGNHGTVFLFASNHPKKYVAVKKEHERYKKYPAGREFQNEAKWNKIVYNLGELSGDPQDHTAPHYVLMPYFSGKTFSEMAYYSLEALLISWIKTAHAVDQLHDQHHVVHCDLKPDNILINEANHEAVVIDLGLMTEVNKSRRIVFSKKRDDPTHFWQHAPEIFSVDERTIAADYRQDVYSLGAILHYAAHSLLFVVYADTINPLAMSTVRFVYQHLTQKNPAHRFSIAKSIFILITSFFSKIPRSCWSFNDAHQNRIRSMQTIWLFIVTQALNFHIETLEMEQNTLGTIKKMISPKSKKIAGLRHLQSDICIEYPALFRKHITEIKAQYPALTKGYFSTRTKTLLNEMETISQKIFS